MRRLTGMSFEYILRKKLYPGWTYHGCIVYTIKCRVAPFPYKSLALALVRSFLPVDRNVERPGSMGESGSNSNFSLFRCAHTQLYFSVHILYCVVAFGFKSIEKNYYSTTTLRINYKLSSDRFGLKSYVYKHWNLENCPTYRYKVQLDFFLISDDWNMDLDDDVLDYAR